MPCHPRSFWRGVSKNENWRANSKITAISVNFTQHFQFYDFQFYEFLPISFCATEVPLRQERQQLLFISNANATEQKMRTPTVTLLYGMVLVLYNRITTNDTPKRKKDRPTTTTHCQHSLCVCIFHVRQPSHPCKEEPSFRSFAKNNIKCNEGVVIILCWLFDIPCC